MFERYTESARRMLFFARFDSSQLGSSSIECEHLLLGLTRETAGIVGSILEAFDVTPAQLRDDVEQASVSRPKTSTSVEIPFSQPCKRTLEFAAAEADALGHSDIGAEHLLLGLLREENTIAWNVLKQRGLALGGVRRKLTELLASGAAGNPAKTEVAASLSQLRMLIDELADEASTPRARDIAAQIRQALDGLGGKLGR